MMFLTNMSRACFVLIFLSYFPIYAQDFTSEDGDCTSYRIDQPMSEIPNVECTKSDEITTSTRYPLKIFLGGLATSQTVDSFKPISYWSMEVEFPLFTDHLMTRMSVDNPALGYKVPSTIIQPARTAYQLSFAVENIKIGKVDGIRIVIFHISDHRTEEITSFSNNQFQPQYGSGFMDIVAFQKIFSEGTQVGLGYANGLSNYNLVRYFDIPGYVITDVGSEGLLLQANQKFAFTIHKSNSALGKLLNGKYLVQAGGVYIWDVQGEQNTFSVATTANTRSVETIYPDGDLTAGYVDVARTVNIESSMMRIHLTSAGQIPVENLHKDTSFTKDDNGTMIRKAQSSGYILLGLEFLPWAVTK